MRVLDFDVQDDTPFLVMDYAVGVTLRQRHPKGSILPLPTIISYVKQVAEALQYAHDTEGKVQFMFNQTWQSEMAKNNLSHDRTRFG